MNKIKCKNLTIKTDGTTFGTMVFMDGEPMNEYGIGITEIKLLINAKGNKFV